MVSFLLSVLAVLLYAAVAVLIVLIIFYFFEQIFNVPIPPQIKKLIWVIIALACIIWLLTAGLGGASIPQPWARIR